MRRAPLAVRDASGFTLIELLIVLAIVGILGGVLSLVLYQLLDVPRLGGAQMAVDSDLRNTGLWLARDGNEAWQFVAGTPPVYGTFYITHTGGITVTTTYRYDSTHETMWRDYQTATESRTTGVARHVAQGSDVTFATSGDIVAVTLTATSGTGRNRVTSSQVYTVTMRVR